VGFQGPSAGGEEAAVKMIWREFWLVRMEFKVIVERDVAFNVAMCGKCGVYWNKIRSGYEAKTEI